MQHQPGRERVDLLDRVFDAERRGWVQFADAASRKALDGERAGLKAAMSRAAGYEVHATDFDDGHVLAAVENHDDRRIHVSRGLLQRGPSSALDHAVIHEISHQECADFKDPWSVPMAHVRPVERALAAVGITAGINHTNLLEGFNDWRAARKQGKEEPHHVSGYKDLVKQAKLLDEWTQELFNESLYSYYDNNDPVGFYKLFGRLATLLALTPETV